MRGDQPVVSAASWMVSASTRPNLTTVVSRFGKQDPPCGRAILASGEGDQPLMAAGNRSIAGPPARGWRALGLAGGEEDRLACLVPALVGAHDRQLHRGGVLQAGERSRRGASRRSRPTARRCGPARPTLSAPPVSASRAASRIAATSPRVGSARRGSGPAPRRALTRGRPRRRRRLGGAPQALGGSAAASAHRRSASRPPTPNARRTPRTPTRRAVERGSRHRDARPNARRRRCTGP